MSGLTQDNPQSNADRSHYMNMVQNAINAQNAMKTGEPDNTVRYFGSLYSMREIMDVSPSLSGMGFNPYDRSGGQKEIHIDIDSHKNEPNDDEKPKPKRKGKGKQKGSDDESDDESYSGGMVLSESAKEYHNKRSVGGNAPTGADFSGADIVNSLPVQNSGPEIGSRARLDNRMPNTNAGQGVQSWTDYPNKNLSSQDIQEATATTRDIQNGFPVSNYPSSDEIMEGIMKLSSKNKDYSQRSIVGGLKRKKGGFAFLAPLAMSAAAPLVTRLASKVGDWLGLGKCGGSKNLKKKIEDDLIELGATRKEGGFAFLAPLAMSAAAPLVDRLANKVGDWLGLGKQANKCGGNMAVASPDIDEGKRAPIIPGLIQATQIDGFQDPRTLGMSSQAGVGPKLASGKKRRNRKPMSDEQKKAFAKRMAEAKAKRRIVKNI
jgi:hypothetical protein